MGLRLFTFLRALDYVLLGTGVACKRTGFSRSLAFYWNNRVGVLIQSIGQHWVRGVGEPMILCMLIVGSIVSQDCSLKGDS